jgi:LytS/YehU family sensor histidine kinase
LLQPLFKKQLLLKKNKIKVLAAFFIAGSVVAMINTVAIVSFFSIVICHNGLSETFEPAKLNLIYASLANLLFHLINAITYYFKEYKSSLLKAEEFKRMSAQAELQSIKSQVNPHFLFNNLNVLSSLVLQNNTDANRFIEEFSKVYRYILKNQEKEVIELSTELHYIDHYIFLLKKRFPEGLKVDILIPERYGRLLIIPAALQMLIENAIKHNVVSSFRPLHIDIRVNGNNTLFVSNNLQAKQTMERSTGIGLQNIIKRYSYVCDRAVIIENEKDHYRVGLPLININ